MKTLGRHVLVELYDCDAEILNNLSKVRDAMLETARRARVTVIDSLFHHFSPQGISGVIVIAESHLAIHTWPEYRYAAVDFFTCGTRADPLAPQEFLISVFRAKATACIEMKRGIILEDSRKTLPPALRRNGRRERRERLADPVGRNELFGGGMA